MVHAKMMDSTSSNNKRRKTSANVDAGLSFLPDAVLASVGEYLALPSRALLAAALTAPSSSWAKRHWIGGPSSAVAQAVMPPGSVTTLDFEKVEKELAVRLSDDDLGAVLAILDAGNTIHKLKLANCLSITGRGLEPLRGSTALQFIDLSLVEQFMSPSVEGENLSEAHVVSILQSILDAEGSALKYLALPNHWNRKVDKSESFTQFHRHYAEHLYHNSRQCTGENCRSGNGPGGPPLEYRCDQCSQQRCLCAFAWFGDPEGDCEGAFQSHNCYECGEIFCVDCSCNRDQLSCCCKCEKWYCAKCVTCAWCEGCERKACSGCQPTVACKRCDYVCCSECAQEGDDMIKCDACGELTCESHNWDGQYVINKCSDCNRTLCIDCCKIQHCGAAYRSGCWSLICNDCQPKDWTCLWCDKDDPDAGAYDFVDKHMREGIRCTRCFKRAKTHCHYCKKVKLRDEDYSAPPVPSSYLIALGYDETYVEKMEKLLYEMKALTLKLKSGERVDYCFTLEGGYRNPNGVVLRHDDILLPHWQEFTEALRQYNLEPERNDYFRLSNVELHSLVLDMLSLALREKNFISLELENVACSTNGIKLAVDNAQHNSKLERLDLVGIRVDKVECLRRLFEAIADHPSLKYISLESVCGASANGHDLLPLVFSHLHGTKTYNIGLRSNNIRTNGATDLPDFVATNNPRLKSLCLKKNNLCDGDALLIAEALSQNNTLERINLGGNDITEVGRNALLSAVCDCASVKTVVASNHTCFIDGLGFDDHISNGGWPRDKDQHERIGKKIYYLFSKRHGEGSNGRHLGSELGDESINLSPNLFERVMQYSPREYGGKIFYSYRELPWVVCPLSILYEFVRSWKLPSVEAREETMRRLRS